MRGVVLVAPLLMLAVHGTSATVAAGPESGPGRPVTRSDVRRFAAHVFARDMKAFHVPGAALVVVRGGRILYQHGYGYANLARKIPVQPANTVFRLASVSAVFTSAAVLRLAADGRVNLHADVNHYLARFKLAENYPRPVILADLLTNTGGFDDRHIGRRTLNASSVQPLGPFLATNMPPRVNPPNQVYSYSTFGFTLAGYIVQTVSKLPFARYVSDRIFQPLAMNGSSFRQPPLPSIARRLATGYDITSGEPRPAPVEYFNVAPGAGMVATPADVAHFIIALLRHGRYRGRRVLTRAAVRDMETQRFTSYPHLPGFPPMPGMTDGFDRYFQNGQAVVDHSGSVRGFTSLLTLLPARNVGLFIVGNAAQDAFPLDIQRRFLDRYYPAIPQRPHPLYAGSSLAPFAGTYWLDGYSLGSIEKLRQLVNQVQVVVTGPNSLTVYMPGSAPSRITRVAPLLFQHVAGRAVSFWMFQKDARGHIIRLVPGGTTVYDKVPWYDATSVQILVAAAIMLILLAAMLSVIVRGAKTSEGIARTGEWLVTATCALDLLFAVAIGLAMLNAVATQNQHYSWFEYGVPAWVYVLLSIPLVTVLPTAGLVVVCAVAWRCAWTATSRLYYTFVTLDAVAFLLYLRFWNLLGFHF